MLEVKNGKIFVNGKETQDHEFIGLAFMDFAEQIAKNVVFDSDPIFNPTNEWSSNDYMYDQEYADKQREADEIVNDIEDNL